MNRILNVHFLPDLSDPHDLAGHTSIVIDVLRASTTITTALHSQAEKVIPCLSVEEARQLARDRPGSLLGGERQGQKLPGFDLGNSPAEYSPDRVAGKPIVFTTTNGTQAMARCVGSARILIGSLVNRRAVCDAVENDERIDIVCAGTNGQFSMEDAMAAGAIADKLPNHALNDAAFVCKALWERQTPGHVLAHSLGGRNLLGLGMDADLELAAQLDRFEIVPELDRGTWEITAL